MESFEISADRYDPSSLTSGGYGQRTPEPSAQRNNATQSETKIRQNPAAARQARPSATPAAPTKKPTADNVSTRRRWKLFAGITLIVFAAYMLIVCVSYFSAGADDQSIVQGRQFARISSTPEAVSNTGGPLGAFLAIAVARHRIVHIDILCRGSRNIACRTPTHEILGSYL